MVMSSSLTDGGLRDCVSRNPDHSLAKLYAACTGHSGDGSYRYHLMNLVSFSLGKAIV